MYTIGKLASEFGISRSTLLYYDSIGILKPSERSKTSYRYYNEDDKSRLKQIVTYRQMGIPLKEISQMLNKKDNRSATILKNQLLRLSDEIRNIRRQQQLIMKILDDKIITAKTGIMDKDTWKNILKSTGLDEEGMEKWHIEFEKSAPQAHYDFLVSLGLNECEIKYIRGAASNNKK